MNKNLKIILIVLILAVLGYFVYDYYGKDDTPSQTEEVETIKIGAILPLTGRLSSVGETEMYGIQYAVNNFRKNNPNLKIELIIEDFKSETKNAVTSANKLINIDKVKAVITSTTAASEAVTPVTDKNAIIHFVISPDSDILDKSKYNFRVYYNFSSEAEKIKEYIKSNKSEIKTAGYSSVNYSSLRKEIEDILKPFNEDNGIKTVVNDYFEITEKDFKSTILKIKEKKPSFLFLAPQVNQIEKYSIQLQEYMPNHDMKIVGSYTFNWIKKDVLLNLEGFIIPTPKFNIENSLPDDFYSTYKENYGVSPNFDAMYVYDATTILIENLLTSSDYEIFRSNFNKPRKYNGASGEIEFIGNNDTYVEVILSKIENGKQIRYD